MDINKVDLLLKYIPAAAGQEDFGNREVRLPPVIDPIHRKGKSRLNDQSV